MLDPAPLAALLNELATSQGAYIASSNELARLKTLSAQGNASARALQTGQAAALHDELAVQSVKDRIALQWGKAVADQNDPAAVMKSLTSLEQALVRIDLPAGENGPAAPGQRAHRFAREGNSVEGAFFGMATSIDPQTQGRGFIFSRHEKWFRPRAWRSRHRFYQNRRRTSCPERLCPARPSCERKVPRAGPYVLQGQRGGFRARLPVALDRPVDTGWFVTNGVTASNYVVTAGAQTLLSEELKGAAKPPD